MTTLAKFGPRMRWMLFYWGSARIGVLSNTHCIGIPEDNHQKELYKEHERSLPKGKKWQNQLGEVPKEEYEIPKFSKWYKPRIQKLYHLVVNIGF